MYEHFFFGDRKMRFSYDSYVHINALIEYNMYVCFALTIRTFHHGSLCHAFDRERPKPRVRDRISCRS